MPLDPEIAPLVQASIDANAALPPVWDQSVEQRRAAYLGIADLAGPGPDLPRVEDIQVSGVHCRLYAAPNPSGLIVYMHGGGFTIGDLETHDEPCRRTALEAGATLIAVNYRRAPENPFPEGLDDSWQVLKEINEDREFYCGPNTNVVLAGDSAGGNFAAVLAILARDAGIDIAAQLLIYPTVDVLDDSPSMAEHGEGLAFTADIMDWFMHQYQPDPTDWRASPMLAPSHHGLAPALVITAEFDMMRDQGIAYANKLRAAGVTVTHTNYDGMVHAFFHLGPLVQAARQAVSQVAAAAKEALAVDAF